MTETGTVEFPIDGVLDLHMFRPAEVRELIPAYVEECRKRRIYSIRIIHGKGKGHLRRMVHTVLERIPEVAAFRLAGENEGDWGATLVELRTLEVGRHDGF